MAYSYGRGGWSSSSGVFRDHFDSFSYHADFTADQSASDDINSNQEENSLSLEDKIKQILHQKNKKDFYGERSADHSPLADELSREFNYDDEDDSDTNFKHDRAFEGDKQSNEESREESEKRLKGIINSLDIDNDEHKYEIVITNKALKSLASFDTVEIEITLKHLNDLGKGHFESSKKIPIKLKHVELFIAKTTKIGRIIWEQALVYSTRHQEFRNTIRVWVVTMDYKKLNEHDTLKYIKKCHMIISKNTDVKWKCPVGGMGNDGPQAFVPIEENDLCRNEATLSSAGAMPYYPLVEESGNQWTMMKMFEMSKEVLGTVLKDMSEAKAKMTNGPSQASNDLDLFCLPNEDEARIIKRSLSPPSLIVVGRSGTGKTLVVLQSMWARHRLYYDTAGAQVLEGHDHQQVFITRNPSLKKKVQQAFRMLQRTHASLRDLPQPPVVEPDLQSLAQVPTEAYPLFVCLEEFLVLIDSTLSVSFFKSKQELDDFIQTTSQSYDDLRHLDYRADRCSPYRRVCTYKHFLNEIWPEMVHLNKKGVVSAEGFYTDTISIIKGSAFGSKRNCHLTFEEYERLPAKMTSCLQGSTDDPAARETIYSMYQYYEQSLKRKNYYDMADVVNHIQRALRYSSYQGTPFHSITVDEVQDFTQAELRLFISVAKDKNSLLFTGDSAQTIAKGVRFRFHDLRSIFYNEQQAVQQQRCDAARRKSSSFMLEEKKEIETETQTEAESETKKESAATSDTVTLKDVLRAGVALVNRLEQAKAQLSHRATSEVLRGGVARELEGICDRLARLLAKVEEIDSAACAYDWWLAAHDAAIQGCDALRKFKHKEVNHQAKWLASNVDDVKTVVDEFLSGVERMADSRSDEKQSKGSHKGYVQMADLQQLTENYRTHNGILRCADSVVSALLYFFPYSVDKLPREKGFLDGPKPLLYNSENESIFLKRHTDALGRFYFGAKHVVIVRNDERKVQLERLFEVGVPLTVFQSKGLEYDEVFLYDFFSDSNAQREWQIAARYFNCKTREELSGMSREKAYRHLEFKELRDLQLCDELKHFYTALTRAKYRVHIIDRSECGQKIFKALVDYEVAKFAEKNDFK